MYIELHARSAFSFLEGASLPEELVGVCQHFQMPAMALLDTDGRLRRTPFSFSGEEDRYQGAHRRRSQRNA